MHIPKGVITYNKTFLLETLIITKVITATLNEAKMG